MAGIDNNTLLYLRGDSFNDLSPNPKEIVNTGAIITAKSNNNCIQSIGNNIIYTNYTSEFNMPEFTLEGNFNFTKSDSNFIFCLGGQSGLYFGDLELNLSNSKLSVAFSNINSNQTQKIYPSLDKQFIIDINTWYHISVVYVDKNVKVFVNGIQILQYDNVTLNYRGSDYLVGIGYRKGEAVVFLDAYYNNIRISNVARYTEDFTSPTQPFNSLTINVSNQNDTNIEFNVEKLGQETINKVEVLVNGIVSETYTDSYDNIDYLIDKSLIYFGNNNITIRVTFDDNYTEEKVVVYKSDIPTLPEISGTSSLLNTLNSIKEATSLVEAERNKLAHILTSKNVEVSEDEKMSELIDKIDLFDDVPERLYLYKDGVFNESFERSNFFKPSENQVIHYESDYFEIVSAPAYSVNMFCFKNINFTDYNKLYVECEADVYSNYNANFTINVNTQELEETSGSVAGFKDHSDFVKGVKLLDVSNVNGTYHLNLTIYYASLKIYKVWLEK